MPKRGFYLAILLILSAQVSFALRDKNYVPLYQNADTHRAYTAPELASSVLVFQRNPEELHPDSFPQTWEKLQELEKLALPGEYCNIYFMLHFTSDDELLGWHIKSLKKSDNKGLAALNWHSFELPFAKRMVGNLPNYTYMPDRFIDYQTRKMQTGENLLCWLQTRIPNNMQPGLYQAEIEVVLANKRLSLPLKLRLLPFTLPQPEHIDWVMYASCLQKSLTHEENVRMLEEIRDLGVTGLIQHQGLYAEADIKKFWQLLRDAKFPLRRLVLDFGAGIEHKSIHAVYGRGPLNTTTTPYAECDNPQVAAEFMATLLRIDAWMKKYAGRPFDWWYQGIDEPQCNGLMGLALWEYPLAKKIGLKTSATVYPYDATKQLASIALDLAVSGSPANSATDNQKFLQLGEQLRLEYWFLGAGSYREQQGSIAANRLLSGWLFWQSAVPAHVSWTYSWSRNEFETGKPSWCMAYPRNNKAERIMDSSLQLEGLREGIIDYKMIALLHKLIEEAKMQKKEKPAESAEALLQNLLSEQIKWRQDFRLARELNAQRSIDNAALEAMRWVLATEIMKLRELLK